MKITLSWTLPGTNQPASFVLADSPAAIPLANLRLNAARSIQEAQLFRATARQFFDRGNRACVITFDTTRAFPDQVSAESFLLMHETQFPGQFNVTFQAGPGTGVTVSRCLKNAVVQSVSSSLTGCTTRHSYRISGGVITTS
jgi:hypothetical protein